MSTRELLLPGCLLAVLAGCPYPQSRPSDDHPVVDSDPRVDIQFRAEAIPQRGEGFVVDDSEITLRSGDRVAFYVSVNKPAYAYVGIHSSDGSQTLIYPSGAEQQTVLSPGAEHRIPSAGVWMKLDKNVGQEDIFVYASKTLLTAQAALDLLREDSKGRVKKVVAATKTFSKKSSPSVKAAKSTATAPPPPGVLDEVRGIELVSPEPSEAAQEFSNGVTRKHVVITHRK